jgi:hypothetical protein
MYDRPASADRPPLGRLIMIVVVLLLAALLAARFIFHVHFGHLLHAAGPSRIAVTQALPSWQGLSNQGPLDQDTRSSQW